MALGIDDVAVGVWTSPHAPTGCTVILPPVGTLGAVAVRGSAPGTREAAALGAGGKITVCHGVLLSGGSAFGLAAADGVMRFLEERGIGHPTKVATIPIVGAAIVLDQGVGSREHRPGPDAGYAACVAATTADPAQGSIGAGTGCSVAKVGGIEHGWRGGQGIDVRRAGGVTVGALVINNAVGEVLEDDGTWLVRSRAPEGLSRYPEDPDALLRGSAGPVEDVAVGPSLSTVIGCVVTDARLTKSDAVRVADLAHSGIARAVRPAHTSFDGDALFCLATGRVDATLDLVASLAADAVAAAARNAVRFATTRDDLPGWATAHAEH